MAFRGGQCWSGSAASRAANKGRRKGRRLSSGISFRRRAVRLMILRVQERIRGRTGGCWDWSRANEIGEFLPQRHGGTEREGRTERVGKRLARLAGVEVEVLRASSSDALRMTARDF